MIYGYKWWKQLGGEYVKHYFGYYPHLLLHYFKLITKKTGAWGTRLVNKAGNTLSWGQKSDLIIDSNLIMQPNIFTYGSKCVHRVYTFINRLLSLSTRETVWSIAFYKNVNVLII